MIMGLTIILDATIQGFNPKDLYIGALVSDIIIAGTIATLYAIHKDR